MFFPRRASLAFFLGVALAFAGCVERRLLIRSEPPGGVALLDNKIVGLTPVAVPFTFYGARQVEVRWDPFLPELEPFATVKETRYLRPPWYEFFPLDLLFEMLWPFPITDERVFDFKLEPRPEPPPEQAEERLERVIKRAESLRASALRHPEEGGP